MIGELLPWLPLFRGTSTSLYLSQYHHIMFHVAVGHVPTPWVTRAASHTTIHGPTWPPNSPNNLAEVRPGTRLVARVYMASSAELTASIRTPVRPSESAAWSEGCLHASEGDYRDADLDSMSTVGNSQVRSRFEPSVGVSAPVSPVSSHPTCKLEDLRSLRPLPRLRYLDGPW